MSIRIQLTRGLLATVDDIDSDLSALPWYASRGKDNEEWYAKRHRGGSEGRRTCCLHRVIWARMHPGEPSPEHIDHRNGDGLDCRRDNLRAADRFQNQSNVTIRSTNTSGFKGVHWHKRDRRWRATIDVMGHKNMLGHFLTAEEAARAYDEAARNHFGEFACLNFPRDGERGARGAA